HALAADDADIKALVQKKLPVTATTLDLRQDEPEDLKLFAPYSKFRIQQQTWKKMMAAGVRLGFGSGATPVLNGKGRSFNEARNAGRWSYVRSGKTGAVTAFIPYPDVGKKIAGCGSSGVVGDRRNRIIFTADVAPPTVRKCVLP